MRGQLFVPHTDIATCHVCLLQLQHRGDAPIPRAHSTHAQEAASLKDPFAAHMAAADKEEMLELDKEVDQELSSPRPEHDKLDKLLAMQVCVSVQAHDY